MLKCPLLARMHARKHLRHQFMTSIIIIIIIIIIKQENNEMRIVKD